MLILEPLMALFKAASIDSPSEREIGMALNAAGISEHQIYYVGERDPADIESVNVSYFCTDLPITGNVAGFMVDMADLNNTVGNFFQGDSILARMVYGYGVLVDRIIFVNIDIQISNDEMWLGCNLLEVESITIYWKAGNPKWHNFSPEDGQFTTESYPLARSVNWRKVEREFSEALPRQ